MSVFLHASIVAAMISLSSCKEDKEKESDGDNSADLTTQPSQNADPKGGGTTDTEPSDTDTGAGDGSDGGSQPSPPRYDPKLGDVLQLSSKSKSWSSTGNEPADFSSALSRDSLVIATYASTAACGYRVRESNAGLVSFRNEKCPAPPVCTSPIDVPKCETESLGTEDVGDTFKTSSKEKTVCTQKEVRGQETVLVKTITYLWKHPKVLRESLIAKSETMSCTTSLASGEAEFDPCNPPAGKTVSFARSIEEVKTQTRGRGGPALPTSAFAKVESADLVAPPAGATLPATCDVTGETMSVNIQHLSCDAKNTLSTVGITIRGLPPAEGRDSSVGANNVVMSIGDDDYSSAVIGDCVISVVKDAKSVLVTGNLECRKKLQGDPVTSTKALDKVNFACSAPTGFVGLEQAMAEQVEKANTASKPAPSGSGTGAGTGTGTGGSGSNSSTTSTTRPSTGGSTNTSDGQIIFVSSFKSTGDIRFGALRGRPAGDAWCADVAAKAKLSGTYRSVLSSDVKANARDHAIVSGKVYNTKGEVIAMNAAEFWSSVHKAPVKFDETGKDQSEDGQVMIGATFDGGHDNFQACRDWTRGVGALIVKASVGNAARADLAWIEAAKNVPCGTMSRIYCMQQK